MHVFAFIIKLTPIAGTLLITIQAWLSFIPIHKKLTIPERTFLRYITPILWGLDIAGLLGLIIIIGALPLLGGIVIRLLIQIYFTWGKQFVSKILENNIKDKQKESQIIESKKQEKEIFQLSQNAQVAALEQQYLDIQNEQEKIAYLSQLKEKGKNNVDSQVAYNRLTKDKDRVTTSNVEQRNENNVNPNNIPSKKPVPEGAQQTPKTLRPAKTPENITKARFERAQAVRKQGQEASVQRQTQSNNLVGEKIAEQAKKVITKKETESQNKLKDLIKSTLTQKLNE